MHFVLCALRSFFSYVSIAPYSILCNLRVENLKLKKEEIWHESSFRIDVFTINSTMNLSKVCCFVFIFFTHHCYFHGNWYLLRLFVFVLLLLLAFRFILVWFTLFTLISIINWAIEVWANATNYLFIH